MSTHALAWEQGAKPAGTRKPVRKFSTMMTYMITSLGLQHAAIYAEKHLPKEQVRKGGMFGGVMTKEVRGAYASLLRLCVSHYGCTSSHLSPRNGIA